MTVAVDEPGARAADRGVLRKRLKNLIADLRGAADLPRESCDALERKLAASIFNLVVVGQFKRGKTSLINALIGEHLLPVGVVPLTSIVTVLEHGERLAVEVRYEDGRCEAVDRERLAEFVTERGNPCNEKHVREVAIAYPSLWLEGGVRLIDTPGIGSVYEHNTDVAQRFLPKADAVLFLLSVEQPVSRSEIDYLAEVRPYAGRIFLLLNKADLVSESELVESMDFARQVLEDGGATEVRGAPELFAVSARLALEARDDASGDLARRSGFPAVTDALRSFLGRDKEDVLLAAVARNLLRLVAQARFQRQLAERALEAPLDALEEKLRRFETRKQTLSTTRDEHVYLLGGERDKLLHALVEKDLKRFEQTLADELATDVERRFEANQSLPSKQLLATLHEFSVEETRRRFDHWRASMDDRLAEAFRAVCERLAARLDDAVDDLFRFAADLFDVPYEEMRGEVLWSEDSGFYYKFWQESTSLTMLASSAVLVLPRLISRRLLLKRAREDAAAIVRTQSGRVRWDFQQRLDKSALAFQRRLSGAVDSVLDGLARALLAGAARQRSGAGEAKRRRTAIAGSLARLDAARDELESILGRLGARGAE